MRYRKKPVVIDAVQLRWDTWGDVCDLITKSENIAYGVTIAADGTINQKPDISDGNRIGLRIETLEGPMLASEGDYIIVGVAGELYACRPSIFESTYEPVEDAA